MKSLLAGTLVFSTIFIFISCSKEKSYENGNPSTGSLTDDGTGDCYPKTVNGTYVADTALKQDFNTMLVTLDVTKAGRYNIFSDTVNGYWFKGSGVFNDTGMHSVTLQGYGKPGTAGIDNFLIVYDSSACNVAVTVDTAGGSGGGGGGGSNDWQFMAGSTTYQGTTLIDTLVTLLPPYLNFTYEGISAANDQLGFQLVDASGAINNGETYSTVISAGNSAVFAFMLGNGSDTYTTDATRNIIFTVTSHNTTTKTIVGTFSGQAKNNAGTTITITNGSFTAIYN